MQSVHNQPFDQAAEGFDKLLRASNLNNRVDDGFVVSSLVCHLSFFRDKFLNDISKLLRESFSHLGSGVL